MAHTSACVRKSLESLRLCTIPPGFGDELRPNSLRAGLVIVSTACFYFCHVNSPAAEPILYALPDYQSPVRGDPDDLLLIPGYGFTRDDIVVYQALADTTRVPAPPASIPNVSSATAGVAPVVSFASVPYSLTVKLPAALQSDQSYVLWVRSTDGWSQGVKINDARPLWLTPAFVHESHAMDALTRYLKVVGRNLQPAPDATTRIRLVGPQTITLDANPSTGAIARYVAKIDLPKRLQRGSYQVQLSRDGVSWVDLKHQTLTVGADPAAVLQFRVEDFGCRPDDDKDDIRCIGAAVRKAAAAGGGEVVFDAGTWDMIDSAADEVTADGIVLPPGVSLTGSSASRSILLRHAAWGDKNAKHPKIAPSSFVLLGRNTIRHLTFKDQRIYRPGDIAAARGILQLGKAFYRATAAEPATISDVVITKNVFDRPMTAIDNGGLPIQRLIVTQNEFGAYKAALNLGGNRYNVKQPFHMDDSIIANNVFKPGSYVDAGIQQGSIASQLGAARRLDFSNNVADGAATQYLQDPEDDVRGWRAAFFWHMNNNHEMVLVAQNTATCTGDKAGDGEAIAYDNNANTFAFSRAQPVAASTDDTVTAPGPLRNVQEGQPVDSQSYYQDHWIRVVDGPGKGQVRRIGSYTGIPGAPDATYNVSPRWDVVPTKSSRLSIGREYWQVYTVDNLIDQRRPLCRKSNLNGPEGGKITLYAQVADSVVEGNRQYDTDGITVQHSYNAEDPACGTCKSGASFQSFVEIRGNTIEGEYDWMSDCSQSGILVSHSAAPTPSSPSPVVGYGLAISHNSITHADGLRGGAISMPITWLKGPPPYDWRLMESTLVHHNVIRDLSGNVPLPRCDHKQTRRIGIHLYQDSLVWNTVLYANTCSDVSLPLVDHGKGTVRVCSSSAPDSCECGAAPTAPDLRIGK